MPATVTSTEVAGRRVAKRQRLNASKVQPEGKPRPGKSRLFAPFRTVGLISPTDVPFTTVPLGKTTFQITTSVGRSLQTYDLRRGLNLVFITRPQTPELITATSAWKDKILAAWGGEDKQAPRGVWLFKRGKKVAELEIPRRCNENIKKLLVFGAWIVGCGSTRIEVWKSETLEHYTTLTAPRVGGAGSLLTGGVCNMPTYLNKILAGRQDGSVEIWNINTGRLLYTILPAAAEYGAVTALQPTPALSLVAISYSSGPVVIHDIRADKEILTVNTGSSKRAPSTELSQGNIRKKAKKMGILSEGLASLDSSLSIEDLRAPKITCMACSLNRDGGMGAVPGVNAIWTNPGKGKGSESTGLNGWESMVTAHEDSKTARTWFWGKKKAGRWAFDTGDGTPVTSVAISPCGTFALVGSQGGGLDMFNLQSGIHRQRFPAKLTPQQAKRLKLQQLEEDSIELDDKPKSFARGQGKHSKAVTGITVDNLNRTVISCGDDGKVKFWDFTNGRLLHEIDWNPMVTITSLRYHSSSDLIAFSCSDSSIRVIDIETKKLVRELFGCQADSVIRVWDLPTGHMIDAMKLRSMCTALGMSATGEYLALAQEDNVGVNIWTNKTLFTHVPTRHISDNDIAEVDAPTASGEGADLAIRSLETPPSHEFLTFIQALTTRLRLKRDYELIQAWMAVFLRLHGEEITSDEQVVQALKEWREEAGKERQRLGALGGYCVGVVGFLRSAR
ncbi:putative wd repeat containing protein 36 protein [Neofusicoccum parvum UCRNP2]|uniref:Putative wd repeat containing protein 36 protein n=1 Tax=Botryosphaeria parva (strain UCR-NP2) TaxID=1287680 RepID=R1GE79_BOTPV|nr:putative wd repeat containing protein 36 protein [Neofusicoccum parvum UCRNP2]